jgi:hypothetical protein
MPHLLRHGTSVFKVISERPVILTSECRALSEVLGLTRPARAGLELTTSQMLSEITNTRLPQPLLEEKESSHFPSHDCGISSSTNNGGHV